MENESSSELSKSDVYGLLSHSRGRLLIRLLEEHPTPLCVDELVALVGERSGANQSPRVVATSLYHVHLPRFDRADVVAYDPNDETVRPGANFDVLVDVLEAASEPSDSAAGR